MVYSYINPGEYGAAAVVFPVVCTVLTGLRFYMRRVQAAKCGADDWLVLPPLALLIAMGGLALWGMSNHSEAYYEPKPVDGQVPYEQVQSEMTFWLVELLQTLGLGAAKLSFVFLYRRIFNSGHNAIFNIISIGMIVFLVLWSLAFFLAIVLICPGHPEAYWASKAIRAEKCYSTKDMLFAFAFTDLVTDLAIYILPIPMILNLHLTTGRKVAVVGIFSLGALAVASSITRAVLWVEFLSAEATHYDIDMLNTNGIYWMLIETGLALMAVNLPILYGLVRTKGIQSIIRSVRSLGSLRSSQRSQSPSGADSPRAAGTRNRAEPSTDVELQTRKSSRSAASESEASEGIHVTHTVNIEDSHQTDTTRQVEEV